jgi:4-amino-4-deoxy-L-arabinose transferase-like glycosyltransferase
MTKASLLVERLRRAVGTLVGLLLLLIAVLWMVAILNHLVAWRSPSRVLVALASFALAGGMAAALPRLGRKVSLWVQGTRAPQGAIVLVALMFLLRLGLAFALQTAQISDYGDYRHEAHDLVQGKGYYYPWGGYAARPPGYPFLLAGAYLVSGEREWGAMVTDALAGTVLATAGGVLVWQLAGPVAGLITLGILGFLPVNLAYTWVSTSEAPFGACLFAGLALVFYGQRTRQSGPWLLFASGLLVGYACLIRPPGLVPAMLCTLYLVAKAVLVKPKTLLGVVFVAGCATAILPWTVRNYLVLHRFVLISTNGGRVFYATNVVTDPQKGGAYMPETYRCLDTLVPNEADRDKVGFRRGARYIGTHAGIFVRSLPHRFAGMFEQHDWIAGYAFEHALRKAPEAAAKMCLALCNLGYWFIPLFVIVSGRATLRMLRASGMVLLIGASYVTWVLMSLFFEAFQRAQYPYFLMPLMLTLAVTLSEGARPSQPLSGARVQTGA